jgi:hypothetical protein
MQLLAECGANMHAKDKVRFRTYYRASWFVFYVIVNIICEYRVCIHAC